MTIDEDNIKLVSETGGIALLSGSSYEQVYHVPFTDGYSTAALLNNSVDALPKAAQEHDEDATSHVTGIKAQLKEDSPPDAGLAVYTVTYSPIPPEGFAANPTDRPPKISGGGGVGITEAANFTTDDTPQAVVNSANDLLSPAPERPIRGSRYVIVRNETDHPGDIAGSYSNTINSDTFHSKAIATCLFEEITWEKATEIVNGAAVSYYIVTYPIRYRPDKWRLFPIDNGTRKLDGDGKPVAIMDSTGNPVSGPVLLDGSGDELASGSDPVIYPTAGRKILYETAWAALSLPDPFADGG